MRPFRDPSELRGRSFSPSDIINSNLCIGCGSCAADHSEARMDWDRNGFLKPIGPASWSDTASEDFSHRCPFSSLAASEDEIAGDLFASAVHKDRRIGRFESAYVGHANEGAYRLNGSSGGLTTWVAAELLRTGMVDAVAHVAPASPKSDGRYFRYRISRCLDEVMSGSKSRYYPIDLSTVIREMRSTPGRYAVVAIPCFIKAIRLLSRTDAIIAERLAQTLGLFCGHMKSASMIESFAWQLGVEMGRVRTVDYRAKDESRPANWYRAELALEGGAEVGRDWWHLADGDWGAGFFQHPACDWCDDVVAETADISFGDAWVEPYSSDGRGTNVMIVRTKELQELIETARSAGRISLEAVGADFIAKTQAAGFRHRRDGLAYRLTWSRNGLVPPKRVVPSAKLPLRRKLVYRLRFAIARWSHRIFSLSRMIGIPGLYTHWARLVLKLYQAVTWSRGPLGRFLDRMLPQPER